MFVLCERKLCVIKSKGYNSVNAYHGGQTGRRGNVGYCFGELIPLSAAGRAGEGPWGCQPWV